MTGTKYRILDPTTRARLQNDQQSFALDVLEGLSENPKRLPSRYLYDDLGSHLFAEIMDAPEYYPPSCETEILTNQTSAILERFKGKKLNLVDLGAGNAKKTMILLNHLIDADIDVKYVPIDISEEAMRLAIDVVHEQQPHLEITGLVAEYSDGIRWLGESGTDRTNFVLFLGSNIGNFTKVQTRRFLRQLWNLLNEGDHVLIGFDMKKDMDVLLRAYNDKKGVTGRFNLNLLERMNRELGANFDVRDFTHYGTYDVFLGAMTSYIVSQKNQTVHIKELQHDFEFHAWEPIHTEYSYKYLETDIDALADYTGYTILDRFYDQKQYFMDALWRVDGRNRIPTAGREEASLIVVSTLDL